MRGRGSTLIRLARALLGLAALVVTLLLLAGFIGQFLNAARYPWVITVWDYTRPLAQLINNLIPTVYRGVDLVLVIALIPVWVLRAVAARGLEQAESRLYVRRPPLRPAAKAVEPTAAEPEQRQAAASPGRVGAPVYLSEALLVIDLVRSSDLVSRFGNSFFFSLKQKLEHLVTPIAGRHAATYTENTGDGFLMCFPSVTHAAGAAQEIYQSLPLLNNDLPEGAEAALRAAVNFGEVIVASQGGNRTGTAVHKTFRLQSVDARGLIEVDGGIRKDEFPEKNYVVVSEEAVLAVRKVAGFDSRYLGLAELKGLPGLHRVYELRWDQRPG